MFVLWVFIYVGLFFLRTNGHQHFGVPPVSKIERTDRIVRLGDPINRTCTATGSPPPKLRWSKTIKGWSLPDTAVQVDGVLHIPEARLTDEGEYLCTATNINGEMTSTTSVLIDLEDMKMPPEYYSQKLQVEIDEPKKLTPNEGDNISFQCEAQNKLKMRPRLTWTRVDGREMPAEAIQDEYGLLTIFNASSRHAGVYQCTGTINKTGDIAQDIGVVELGPASQQPFMVAIEEPKSKSTSEKFVTSFRCVVVSGGTRPHKFTWTREDHAPLDEHTSVQDGKLIFGGVKKEHAGTYICSATVLGTQTTGSDKARLKIEPYDGWYPLIEISPPVLTVKLDDPINLTCTASGSRPPYKLEWIGPRRTLPDTAQVSDGVLHIPRAQATDDGLYSCKASNNHAVLFNSAFVYLETEIKPPKVQVVPKSKVLKPGQNFAFKCDILEGNPTTQLTWISDKATLDDNVRLIKDGLQITDARDDNSGQFTCIGKNSHGEHRDTAELTVREDDLDIQIKSGVENGTVIVPYLWALRLECLADAGPGRPEATVQWSYVEDSRPGDLPANYTPVTINGRDLRHIEPTIFNNGVYTCRATSGNLTKDVSIYLKSQPREEK